ncbi:Dyp-type peroxidase [Thiotrichales bacterium 19S11-10]|nr:Dyp-type peroxidase [Thiotrichales bacterium 19S11-10]MCF6806898.1 Dyp-type peroxidase [Thiotrichales bacterium 19S9-11]MCF6810867.1 Dyp-type peroxidase [Thiotrichales bacterium 19S9-12]
MLDKKNDYQFGITEELTSSAYYLIFSLKEKTKLSQVLFFLKENIDGQTVILGLGEALMEGSSSVFYHPYKAKANQKELAPEEKGYDLALWVKSNDMGNLFHRVNYLIKGVADAFILKDIVQGVTHKFTKKDDQTVNHGLDGFEDGTENPQGDEIITTAINDNGESFWSLQKWQHNFNHYNKLTNQEKEALIGRSLEDNHEFEDNLDKAHVSRTAQESFDPQATIWRRSMPWVKETASGLEGGLMFSSFAHSFYPFDAQFNRMAGNEDDITDGVFEFSDILYTAFFYCPPIKNNQVDFSVLKSQASQAVF